MAETPSVFDDSFTFDTHGAAETLADMMEQERRTYAKLDYLDQGNNAIPGTCQNKDTFHDGNAIIKMTSLERMNIVDWCYSMVDHCELDRENVAKAMEIVDRFFTLKSKTVRQSANANESHLVYDSHYYQLVAVTALYISIKLHERVAFSSKFFASICRGNYSVKDIEEMELEILKTLQWMVSAPTSLQMAHYILSLMLPHLPQSQEGGEHDGDLHKEEMWGLVVDEIRFLSENSVRDYYFATQRPSTVAVAAVLNAFDVVPKEIDRNALFMALLRAMNRFDFDSTSAIFAARQRLMDIVGKGCIADEEVPKNTFHSEQMMDDHVTTLAASSPSFAQSDVFPMQSLGSMLTDNLVDCVPHVISDFM